jgi:hypothetical protein
MKPQCLFLLVVTLAISRASLGDEPKTIKLPPATGDAAAWVDEQVSRLAPSAEDKRFDEIGWSREIVAAQALAKANGRPLFLFSHDGRMNEGRC